MSDVYEGASFSQEGAYKWSKQSFATTKPSLKYNLWSGNNDSPVKKKLLVQWSVK